MGKNKAKNFSISDFYCVECGNQGISVPRNLGQKRETGHLKKMFCIHCQQETNHAEVRTNSKYTVEDFRLEYNLGRFKDGLRVPIAELTGCSKHDCDYNIGGKCWNANYSYDCKFRCWKKSE